MGKWKMVRLGDTATVQAGGTPARNNQSYWKDGTIPWVKISDLHSLYTSKTEEYITEQGLACSSAKLFHPGTILYTIFATLGEVSILNIEAATNQAIAGININDSLLNPLFLVFYLKSIKNNIMDTGRGVAQNNINLSILRNLLIPLPPLDVQKKIADVLDKASTLIELRRAQLDKLDLLIKSQFIEMFGDPVKNPMGWTIEPLSKHLKIIGGYAFKSTGFIGEGIPVLRIGNINAGYFRDVNLVFWKYDESLTRYMLYPGDLVISLTGTVGKDDYGNVCVLGIEYSRYYLNQRNAKLELQKTINKNYLLALLKFPKVKSRLTGISRGVRQANISNSDILNLEVPIPPITRQNHFADFVSQVENQKQLLNQSLSQLELNYKSLMQKCFRGELF